MRRRWRDWLWLAFCAAVLVSRRPSGLLHATFVEEEGKIFYADAFREGAWSVLVPYAGYLHMLPRLVALIAVHLSLTPAATLMHVVAGLVELLPAGIILSGRMDAYLPNRAWRWLAALAVVVTPNASEMHFDLTVAAFSLALVAVMLILAPATSRGGRLGDGFLVGLSALTGPFVPFLLGLSAFLAWRRRSHHLWVLAGLGALCMTVQAIAQLPAGEHRPFGLLNGSVLDLARILGGQFLAAPLFGTQIGIPVVFITPAVAFIAAALVIGFVGYLLWRGNPLLRAVTLFGLFVLGAALSSPQDAPFRADQWWRLLSQPEAGPRYFYPLLVALLWGLGWLLVRRGNAARVAMVILSACLMGGIRLDWVDPYHGGSMAGAERAISAAEYPVVVTEEPAGWTMTLKRP